jgi:membrane protein YdbS with pleckstrin-like domain
MSYIDQSLGPHERIIARAQLAWIYRVSAWLTLLGVLAGAGTLFSAVDHPVARMAAGGLAIAGAIAFVAIMIPNWTTEIAVTNQRLIVKRGLLSRSSEELQLWSIEEVDWEQGPLDRLAGFGHLVICGTGDEDMRLPLISDALAFRKALQHAINDARPGKGTSTGTAAD